MMREQLRRGARAGLAVVTGGLWLLTPAAEAADFLPAVSLHLEAARYAPVETDLHWTTTMGGGADLVGIGGFRGYIVGDVETLIGNTRRAFDASQANYTLETGGRWRVGRVLVNPFFHHVSRHLIDREKAAAVDWNILGARAETDLGRVRVGASVGHTTLASLVGYRWELIGHGEVEAFRRARVAGYGAARARLVTIDPDPELRRGDFIDWAIEGGVRFPHDHRVLEAFAAYERRNDVYLVVPGALDRALFGARIRLDEGRCARRTAPARGAGTPLATVPGIWPTRGRASEGVGMDLIITLVVGGIIGWAASLIMGTDQQMGALANVLIGVVGSVLGLWLAGVVGLSVAGGPARWLASLTGAIILIAIVRALGLMRPRRTI